MLKDIDSERADGGGWYLVSNHRSIKLDKFKSCVFAAAGLLLSK